MKNWIVFDDGGRASINETMNPHLVLTQPIDPKWLIAGAVTRYAQYGLRLPTPNSQPFGAQVAAIFDLTRQQQALVSNNGKWNTAF